MIRKLLKQKLRVSYDSKSRVFTDRHHLSENYFVLFFLFFTGRPEDQHPSLCNRSTLVSRPCLIINFVKESIWLLSSNKTNTGFFFTTLTIFISVQILVRAIKFIRSLEHS